MERLCVGDHALHFDVAERAGVEHAARQRKASARSRFVIQLIDCGTPHHALDRQLRAHGRHHDRVPGLQACRLERTPCSSRS